MSIVVAAMTACKPPAFACDDDDACENGDAAGVCEPTGFCSFPDKQCDGGRRYGEFADDGLSRECVPNEIATGEGTTGGVATVATDTGTATAVDTGESTAARPDAYGPCESSQDCTDPTAACVTNGPNQMCAPSCSTPDSPSSECPPDVNGDAEGIGCLYTDAAATLLRCFVTCSELAECPSGMICAAPVCTWAPP